MVSTSIIDVSPELAQAYLAENKNNRNLTPGVVRRYTTAMETGHWLFDGSPVRVSESGNLLDGQHRLQAVVNSKTTQKFLILEGLPDEVQAVMDTGKKRSFGDVLSMKGEQNVLQLASIVALAQRYDQGMRGNVLMYGTFPNDRKFKEPQIPELLEFLAAHPELRNAVKSAGGLSRIAPAAPRVWGFAYWLFASIDQTDADYFIEKIKTGSGLEEGSPMLTLRTQLQKQHATGTSRPQAHYLAMIIKAWNFYRDGDPLYKITLRFGGANPEPYPEAK